MAGLTRFTLLVGFFNNTMIGKIKLGKVCIFQHESPNHSWLMSWTSGMAAASSGSSSVHDSCVERSANDPE